jgi:hypothetical protein
MTEDTKSHFFCKKNLPIFSMRTWVASTLLAFRPHSQKDVKLGSLSSSGSYLTCVEPVSWFSKKVTAREGHQPITPGGLPCGSISRQYSLCSAECKMPCKRLDEHTLGRCLEGTVVSILLLNTKCLDTKARFWADEYSVSR